jgi:hypothetical protein
MQPFAARIKQFLFSDANDFFEPGAFLRTRRAHPLRWQILDLCWGAAGTAAVWLVVGRIAGIVFAAIWAVLTVLGLLAYVGGLMTRRSKRDSGGEA